MAYLITQILIFLLVAVALGLAVGWLARDLMAEKRRRSREQFWRRQLRQSESQAGNYKNQLTEEKLAAEKLREELRQARDVAIVSQPKSKQGETETFADLRAELARRDKKIDLLQLQVAQSGPAVKSEWQSINALKSELAERQRRLESRSKRLDAQWSGKLKEGEEARQRLEQHIVALKRGRDRLETELATEREHSSKRIAELEAELEERRSELEERRSELEERRSELHERRSELEERDALLARIEAAPAAAVETADTPTDEQDDLEKIRGIGPVLHRKLNALGIYSFGQIAAWTEDDVARVTAELGSFRGRVRRDNWIERAAKLMRLEDS